MSLLNGIVYSELGELGEFINGEREGRHKRWYENGQLRFEGNYINRKEDGLFKICKENGDLSHTNNYKNGKRDGISKIYIDGKLHLLLNIKTVRRMDYLKVGMIMDSYDLKGIILMEKKMDYGKVGMKMIN